MATAMYEALKTTDGAIAFEGLVRHVQEYGANVFRIDLPSRTTLYGEWRPIFAANGNDFNIEILSFGYQDRTVVSNGFYIMFNHAEMDSVQRLIETIFRADHLREKFSPFNSIKAKFLGEIIYKSGWIIIENEYRAAIKKR